MILELMILCYMRCIYGKNANMIRALDKNQLTRFFHTSMVKVWKAFKWLLLSSCVLSWWIRCKTMIKAMKGVRRNMLSGYLDEFMWRERAGPDKFNAILNAIAVEYPVAQTRKHWKMLFYLFISLSKGGRVYHKMTILIYATPCIWGGGHMSICNCKTNRNHNTENQGLFKGGRIFKREILLFKYTPPYVWGGGFNFNWSQKNL